MFCLDTDTCAAFLAGNHLAFLLIAREPRQCQHSLLGIARLSESNESVAIAFPNATVALSVAPCCDPHYLWERRVNTGPSFSSFG